MFSQKEENGIDIYTLTITEEKGKVILVALMETLKNDDIVLNKFKQLYIEQFSATEQEAQALIDSLKTSIGSAISGLNSTSNNTDTTETSENLTISVYVSENKLVKTEVSIANEGKIVFNNNDNNMLIEIMETTDLGDNKSLASVKIEKNKTDNELSYKITMNVEQTEVIVISLTYTGLKEMTNVGANLLVDIDLSDIMYGNSLNRVQDIQVESKNIEEQEKVTIALSELITKYYEDTYVSATEFEINETTIKQYMDKQGLDITVSRNEDGTFKVQSNTTGNIFTVNSSGTLTNTEFAENTETETENATESEKKTLLKISLNLNGTTSFGEVQEQELNNSNMYKINDKTLEQIETLFTQIGERAVQKINNVYKNTPVEIITKN